MEVTKDYPDPPMPDIVIRMDWHEAQRLQYWLEGMAGPSLQELCSHLAGLGVIANPDA